MKIVYLVNGHLTSRWQSYYCLDAVAEHFDIEFWNCSRLVEFPNKVSEVLQRPYIVDDITWDNFETLLRQLPKDTIVVPEIAISPIHYSFYKLVAKYVSIVVTLDFWESPMSFNISAPIIAKNTNESLLQRAQKIIKLKIFDCWWKLHFKTYHFSTDSKTKFALNYPDVEKYYQLESDNNHYKGRYVVYIGQYFPFHSDTQRLEGADVVKLAPSFYKSMNNFFEKVEKEMDCEVIIAEHPSARHEENPYKGRKIIYYKTAELIRDSIAVCMHFSNSSSFVLLYDKPVALLECDAIRQTRRFSQHNREFAKALGREPVNVDQNPEIQSLFTPIDRNIRKEALDIMLRKGKKQLNKDLLVRYFKGIQDKYKS